MCTTLLDLLFSVINQTNLHIAYYGNDFLGIVGPMGKTTIFTYGDTGFWCTITEGTFL